MGVYVALLLHFPRYNETYQEKSWEMWVIRMKMTVAAEGKFLYSRQCSERGSKFMTILMAGSRASLLRALADGLTHLFPDADIIMESDSLMAGKYAFDHDVDMIISEINMKRLNGVQLIQFVKQECPESLTYLVGTQAEFDESPVAVSEDIAGIVLYPFTQETFQQTFHNSKLVEQQKVDVS